MQAHPNAGEVSGVSVRSTRRAGVRFIAGIRCVCAYVRIFAGACGCIFCMLLFPLLPAQVHRVCVPALCARWSTFAVVDVQRQVRLIISVAAAAVEAVAAAAAVAGRCLW